MIFNIVHTTAYEYSAPAIESFTELRVRPRQSNRQIVQSHVTEVTPHAALEEFTDYYDNAVECLSVPYRHKTLTVTSRSTVETLPHKDVLSALDLSVSEAVRLNWPQRRELFDFLMPSRHAPITPELEQMSKQQLPSRASFAESMLGLCKYIYETFTYMPGVTDIRTPLTEVLRKRQGVCQDFAHLMIALRRVARALRQRLPRDRIGSRHQRFGRGDGQPRVGRGLFAERSLGRDRPDQRHARGRTPRADRDRSRLRRRAAAAGRVQGRQAPAAFRHGYRFAHHR